MGHRYRSDLMDGLKFHWDMYELSGSRFDSVAGLELTDVGTVTGTTGVHPNKNATVHDEALTEYLDTANNSDAVFADVDLTVAVWHKFEAAAYSSAPLANDQILVAKGTAGGDSAEYGIWLNGGTPGTLEFECRGGSTRTVATIATTDLTTGAWALAIGRHDSVNNTLDLYYRAVGQAEKNATQQAHTDGITDKASSLRIGANGDAGNLFAGNIDSVSIWQKRLTDAQLDQLFRKQLYAATEQLPFPF